jgi:hypothetical protein
MVDEFNEFRITVNPRRSNPISQASGMASVTTPICIACNHPVADFRKGIKRDAALFVACKEECQRDNWQRLTNAQARMQSVTKVFDATYVPMTSDKQELFKGKQEYIYI